MIRNKKLSRKLKRFSKGEILYIFISILIGLIGLARVGYFTYRSADVNNVDFVYKTHIKERKTKNYGEVKISDQTVFYVSLEEDSDVESQIFLNQLEAEKYFKNYFISKKNLLNNSYSNILFDHRSIYSFFMNYLDKVDFNNNNLMMIKSKQKDYNPTQLKIEEDKLILFYDAVIKENKTALIFLVVNKITNLELEEKYFKYFIANTKKDY